MRNKLKICIPIKKNKIFNNPLIYIMNNNNGNIKPKEKKRIFNNPLILILNNNNVNNNKLIL